MHDSLRQTGRTTKQLQTLIDQGGEHLYLIHAMHHLDYIHRLIRKLYEVKGHIFKFNCHPNKVGRITIHVPYEGSEDLFRGSTFESVTCDHAFWELCTLPQEEIARRLMYWYEKK